MALAKTTAKIGQSPVLLVDLLPDIYACCRQA